jgi:hypothetical protein
MDSVSPHLKKLKKTPWSRIILVIAYSRVAIVLQVPKPLSCSKGIWEEFSPGWKTVFSSSVQCTDRFRNRSLSNSEGRFTLVNISSSL